MTLKILVNIGSENGLWSDVIEPLPEPPGKVSLINSRVMFNTYVVFENYTFEITVTAPKDRGVKRNSGKLWLGFAPWASRKFPLMLSPDAHKGHSMHLWISWCKLWCYKDVWLHVMNTNFIFYWQFCTTNSGLGDLIWYKCLSHHYRHLSSQD